MYSNLLVIREIFCQEKCFSQKNDYLKCINVTKHDYLHKHQYNAKLFKCQLYLNSYLSCLNYKIAPSIIEE